MLSNRLYHLLTAYVDGELDPRQEKAIAQLLQQSAEAQRVLQKLQEDARALRGMPRLALDQTFAHRVLQKLPAKPVRASRYAGLKVRSGVPSWLGLASAAAVLFLISLSTYLYFVATTPDERGAVARSDGSPAVIPRPDPEPAETDSGAASPRVTQLVGPPRPPEVIPRVEATNAVAKTEPEILSPPLPEPTPADAILTVAPSLIPEMEVFQRAPVSIALVVPFGELDQEKRKQQLLDELRKGSAYRIDLACLETAPAIERMQAAFQAHGIRCVIDSVAQERLKWRFKWETNYALYTENVTPEEVFAIFKHIAAQERTPESKQRGPIQFDTVAVNSMTRNDHRELSKLLGVGSDRLDTSQGPKGVDIHKPLSAKTTEEVVQTLKGQGGSPLPEPGKALPSGPERLAVLVAYNPARPRPASREVKLFLDSRKERAPGTIQMLLVVRGTKG
jgi:hypothetical protein